MALDFIQNLKTKASQWAYGSGFYHWSLNSPLFGGDVPDRLLVKPVDVWPGCPERGQRLCEGVFSLGDDALQLRGACWEPFGVDERWLSHMHGFTWLRDLPAFAYKGGNYAAVREHARMMIIAWIDRYRHWKAFPWRPDITGERVAMWISMYEFFAHDRLDGDEDEEFHDLFFESLGRQAQHLARCVPADLGGPLHGLPAFRALKGLLYAGLALEGREAWIRQALDLIERQIEVQILGDGAHVSRSAQVLLDVLQVLLDIRSALCSGGHPLPEAVQHAIDKMGPALRFYRYSDKGFGVFNGTQEGECALVDCVLAQTGAKGKAPQSLPCAGYERVQLGRTLLMLDSGAASSRPYDGDAHAAPLAFEMAYAKERIFVNCGTHPCDAGWQDALRGTGAHNALTLDHRNACEIGPHGYFVRKASKVDVMREDTKQACLLDGVHNGYESLNGFLHRRRLYLSEQGHDLRGEDSLNSHVPPARVMDYALRFHMHPRVNVSLINQGQEALLRTPSGLGWRFSCGGGCLALEDSVYLGQGVVPQKTKQLVICGQITDNHAKIKWRMSKEG